MRSICIIGSWMVATGAIAACPAPEQAVNASVEDKQPRISWKAAEGATGYRVRILSRVPNGKILASYDSVVQGTSFLPPQPLADQRAKVTVRLNAICGSETSEDSVAAFVIDATPACRLAGFEAAVAGGSAQLKWTAVKGATSYEVRTFAPDGAFVRAEEVRSPAAKVELGGRAAMVSVRPVCAAGVGEAVYRAVAAD